MGGVLWRNTAHVRNGLGKENEKENEKAEQFESTRRINGGETMRRRKKGREEHHEEVQHEKEEEERRDK